MSKSPCSRDSNTAHRVELAKAWMKYVADGDEAEKSNSGSTLIAMTAEAEPMGPDV